MILEMDHRRYLWEVRRQGGSESQVLFVAWRVLGVGRIAYAGIKLCKALCTSAMLSKIDKRECED